MYASEKDGVELRGKKRGRGRGGWEFGGGGGGGGGGWQTSI